MPMQRHGPNPERKRGRDVRWFVFVLLALAAGRASAQQPWWTTAGNFTRCIESRWSPADRIEEIRGSRLRPEVREMGPAGAPHTVEVSGGEWTWTYYRTLEACERALRAGAAPSHLR
jgi:hypothetical protein